MCLKEFWSIENWINEIETYYIFILVTLTIILLKIINLDIFLVLTRSRTITCFSFIHITVLWVFFNSSLGEQIENIQKMNTYGKKKMDKKFRDILLSWKTYAKKVILCFKASRGNQNISLSTFTSIKMHYGIHQKTILY